MKPLVIFLVVLLTGSAGVASQQAHDHGAMAAGEGQFNPYVIADSSGGYYAAYVERRDGGNNLFVHRINRTGASPKPVRVNSRIGDAAVRNENPPKLALGPRGELYAVWANERERWKGNVLFSRSTDGGKSFSPTIVVNSAASGPPVGRAFQSIAVTRDGRIHIVWIDERNKTATSRGAEVWMASSNDGGRTFTADRRILSDVCECCRLTLLARDDGTLFLSYRTVPSAGPMYRDIAVARSTDGGRTFQSTIVNHDGWEINACPIAGATIALDRSGRLTVLWFTESRGVSGLYYASSTDDARTFLSRSILTSQQKLARHGHLAAAANGRLIVAWDDSDGNPLVRWGELDPAARTLKVLGTSPGSSYPIVASNTDTIVLVALQPGSPQVFQKVIALLRR